MIAPFAPASTLRLKRLQVVVNRARLRMEFGITGDFDVKVIARGPADEFHEFIRIAQFARTRRARGQVAAQRDDVAQAVGFVQFQGCGNVIQAGADAGNMRRGIAAGVADVEHGIQGAIAGRTARRRR